MDKDSKTLTGLYESMGSDYNRSTSPENREDGPIPNKYKNVRLSFHQIERLIDSVNHNKDALGDWAALDLLKTLEEA